MKISTKTTLLPIITVWFFSGCAALLSSDQAYYVSKVELNRQPVHQNIIDDITRFLTAYYPVSQTTFAITVEDSSYTYGLELENALRRAGYGVVYLSKEGSIPFAYQLSLMNEDMIRATYNVGSANISRLYRQSGTALQAISPFTTRGLPEKLILSSSAPFPQASFKSAAVTASTLNVRTTPSIDGEIIDHYTQGDTLQVASPFTNEAGESWCQVYDESGEERYIATQYIEYLN